MILLSSMPVVLQAAAAAAAGCVQKDKQMR